MTAKVVAPLSDAVADFNAAIDYYLLEAGEAVAERFVSAVEATYAFIASAPGGGSTRLGELHGLPDMRSVNLRGFPYVVFYVERPDRVEIVRILHGQRDLEHALNSALD